jgi:putative DNA primase/helicase
VAAIMSAVVRRSLPTCPVIAVTAPHAGSGKSLIIDVIAAIATGRRASILAPAERDEETEKRLAAALLAGDPIVSIDNVERPLRGELLCQASTYPVVSIRPLAASALIRVRTNALLATSGNNLVIRGDLTRRVMMIILDARTERPECRRFGRDAVEHVMARRGELVQAALAITISYLRAGEPEVACDPYGGYETWDQWIRRPLLWLGLPDPLAATRRVRQDDPERASMSQVYAAIAGRYPPGTTYYARDLVDGMAVDAALHEALEGAISAEVTVRSVGYWLRGHADRMCDGLALRRSGEDRIHTVIWTIEEVVG